MLGLVPRRRFAATWLTAIVVAAAVALAGCSSAKHNAATPSGQSPATISGPASGSPSGAPSGAPSGPTSGSPLATVSGDGVLPSHRASAGPGVAANLPQAQIQATVSKTGLSVRLHAGQVIEAILPPPAQQSGSNTKYELQPAGSKALTPIAGAPGFYTGAAPGTVKIVVTQTPKCPVGSACPAHAVEVGTLSVTVWK